MERIVIFGATGDLTARYLLPALAKLYEAGKLPEGIKIIGVDRREWEDDKHGFRAPGAGQPGAPRAAASRPPLARGWPTRSWSTAGRRDRRGERDLGARAPDGPILAYLALPPAVFAPTLEALKAARPARGEPGRHREALRGEPRVGPGASTGCCTGSCPRRPSSASTTSSPGSRSRPSWACASPTASSSRSGTATT